MNIATYFTVKQKYSICCNSDRNVIIYDHGERWPTGSMYGPLISSMC